MKTVGITMDLPEGCRDPAPGDVIVSILHNGTWGSAYAVVTAREVVRRVRPADGRIRFALRCRRATKPLWPHDPDWFLQWHPRRRQAPP